MDLLSDKKSIITLFKDYQKHSNKKAKEKFSSLWKASIAAKNKVLFYMTPSWSSQSAKKKRIIFNLSFLAENAQGNVSKG